MNLKEVNVLELYNKWCFGSGYFEPFIRTGPFVSLKYFQDMKLEAPREKDKTYFEKIRKYINTNEETLIIIDVDGVLAMELGYKLNKIFNLWPIIVFNFLLHPYGLVGDKEFINSLFYYGQSLKSDNTNKVVMLLDHNRFSNVEESHLVTVFNNQYELSEEDLPSIEMLNTLKYKKVLYFCEEIEKEDIKYYLEYLRNNNIVVESISLKQGVN
ncbi:MAG: hypothetical protein AB6733_18715 [Clostridiaceae bacterium]